MGLLMKPLSRQITLVILLFLSGYTSWDLAAQEDNAKNISPSKARITAYEAAGNLALTHEIDCIPLGVAQNGYTPPDLYNAFAKCVQENSYENATGLFLLAGSYARFDALRVTDKTAHQARTVLIMNYTASLSEQQKKEWNAYAGKFTPESKELASTCEIIRKIGAPNYYPAYMIQHGMNAFSKEKIDPIVKDFDSKKVWETILKEALHCAM